MILIVGLGNPTEKYKNNRHNIGFMVVDAIINDLEATNVTKSSFKGLVYKSKDIILLKPLTFMNLSGESVHAVSNFYKPKKIIVIHDELDLPFGQIRFKNGGSSGGHNGLKSIDSYIKEDYYRVRVGISKPIDKDLIIKHVLGDFQKDQLDCLKLLIKQAEKITLELTKQNIKTVQQKYPNKRNYCL